MSGKTHNHVTVSYRALQHNYSYIKSRVATGVKVMAMVKADAYGHDMIRASRAFADVGCDTFGVAELGEAVQLRESGITGSIYVMIGFAEDEVDSFFEHDLTPVVYDYNAACALSLKALELGTQIGVHIKVDTGMGRLGVTPAALPEFAKKLAGLQGLLIAGVMSHFPESDNPESLSTRQGFGTFTVACSALGDKFKGICHIANSGAVLNFPNTHCNMVRAGIALYGYHPAGKIDTETQPETLIETLTVDDLIPAMSFRSKVLQVKTVPEGTGISYGLTFITERETRLAVLPVGYEDGFSRILSNRGEVLIRGRRAVVRGRVCMNICMVDVTDIDGVSVGDEVVFLGRQGENVITADDIAEKMGSISYEVLCLLGNNNKRTYRE